MRLARSDWTRGVTYLGSGTEEEDLEGLFREPAPVLERLVEPRGVQDPEAPGDAPKDAHGSLRSTADHVSDVTVDGSRNTILAKLLHNRCHRIVVPRI